MKGVPFYGVYHADFRAEYSEYCMQIVLEIILVRTQTHTHQDDGPSPQVQLENTLLDRDLCPCTRYDLFTGELIDRRT